MKKRWGLAVCLGCALAQLPSAASAVTLNVPCTGPSGGPEGVADAIATANSTPGTKDTIRLAPGCVYTLSVQNDTGTTKDGAIGAALLPRVSSKIAIEGRDAVLARDDAASSIRIVNVDAAGHLILGRVKVRNGYGSTAGAIYNDSGKLTIAGSTFSGNESFSSGGAILSRDDLVVRNSTFFGNTTGDPVLIGGSSGGAISNHGDATISNSTFYDNVVDYNIYGSYGGALANHGTMTITHSTIAENDALLGGGLYGPSGSLVVRSSVISANTATNCVGTAISGSSNVVFDGDDTTDDACPGQEANPRLRDPADNGGPTKTMALRADSAAISHVPQNKCAARDQRGERRPTSGKCDAGAFEKNPL